MKSLEVLQVSDSMGYDTMQAWDSRSFEFSEQIQQRGGFYSGVIPFSSDIGSTIIQEEYIAPDFQAATSSWSPPDSPTNPLSRASSRRRARRTSHSSNPTSPCSTSHSPTSPTSPPLQSPRADSAIHLSPTSSMPSLSAKEKALLSDKLYAASCAGNLEHIRLLLSLGAPIDMPTHVDALYEAFKPPKSGRLSPLAGAATYGQYNAVSLLLLHGANPNPHLNTSSNPPLIQACRANDPRMARLLLEAGANVNGANCYKTTSLMYAVKYGGEELVSLLLAHNPDLSAISFINTAAIHWAVWPGNVPIMDLLLRAGADPNHSREDESTPLHYAALVGFDSIAACLLRWGADPTRRDPDGKTPGEVALANGHLNVVRVLNAAEILMTS